MSDESKPWGYAVYAGRPLGWVANRDTCRWQVLGYLEGNFATEEEARAASDLYAELCEDADRQIWEAAQ